MSADPSPPPSPLLTTRGDASPVDLPPELPLSARTAAEADDADLPPTPRPLPVPRSLFIPPGHACVPEPPPLDEVAAQWAVSQGEVIAQLLADAGWAGSIFGGGSSGGMHHALRMSGALGASHSNQSSHYGAFLSVPSSARRGSTSSGDETTPRPISLLPPAASPWPAQSQPQSAAAAPSLPSSSPSSASSSPASASAAATPRDFGGSAGGGGGSASGLSGGVDVGVGSLVYGGGGGGSASRPLRPSGRGSAAGVEAGGGGAVGQPSHVAGAGESVKILYAALQNSETEKETLADRVAQLQQRLAHAELAAAQLEEKLQRQQREAATAAAQAAITAADHARLLRQQQDGAKRPQPVFVLGSSFFHARPL